MIDIATRTEDGLVKRVIYFDGKTDIPFVLVASVLIFTFRKIISKYVFEPFARHMIKGKITKKDKKEFDKELKKRISKFTESAWNGVYYLMQAAVGIYAVYNTPWLYDFVKITVGYPHVDEHDFPWIRVYYLLGISYYTQALFALVFVDARLNDFYQMFTHHIVTLVVGIVSMVVRCHRGGSLVFLLHDIVDIFLYSTKSALELEVELASNILFVVFAILYLVLRLGVLPYIIYIMLLECYGKVAYSFHYYFKYLPDAYSPVEVSSYGVCLYKYCVSPYYIIVGGLMALVCLHIFWYYLIIQMAITTIQEGNVPPDVRDDENEKNLEKSNKSIQNQKDSKPKKD